MYQVFSIDVNLEKGENNLMSLFLLLLTLSRFENVTVLNARNVSFKLNPILRQKHIPNQLLLVELKIYTSIAAYFPKHNIIFLTN